MPQSINSLQDATRRIDRKAVSDHVRQGELERQEILKRFPLEEWANMPLEIMPLVYLNPPTHFVDG